MLVAEITNSARITQPEILNTRPVLGAFSNDGLGATLAAWRRLEHRQLGAGYRTFPDRAVEPWNGEVRPFDPKQSLLTTADFGR